MSTRYATGRRKTAIARVFLSPGTGRITINKLPLEDVFPDSFDRDLILSPFKITEKEGHYDVVVNAHGGGTTGQKEAIRHGISRALSEESEEVHATLKQKKLLTRDPRRVQPKRYGRRKARRKHQFSKR